MGQVGTSFPANGGTRTIYHAPFGSAIASGSGSVSWSVPDAMTIKQVTITPEPLQGGNDQSVTITFSLQTDGPPFGSDGLGVFTTRANLTYVNSAADTSPPPSDPMNPGASLGEVWDLGLVVLKNSRIRIKMTTTSGPNDGGDRFFCGFVGEWLRDVPA